MGRSAPTIRDYQSRAPASATSPCVPITVALSTLGSNFVRPAFDATAISSNYISPYAVQPQLSATPLKLLNGSIVNNVSSTACGVEKKFEPSCIDPNLCRSDSNSVQPASDATAVASDYISPYAAQVQQSDSPVKLLYGSVHNKFASLVCNVENTSALSGPDTKVLTSASYRIPPPPVITYPQTRLATSAGRRTARATSVAKHHSSWVRKNLLLSTNTISTSVSLPDRSAPKRGRGRPRKIVALQPGTGTSNATELNQADVLLKAGTIFEDVHSRTFQSPPNIRADAKAQTATHSPTPTTTASSYYASSCSSSSYSPSPSPEPEIKPATITPPEQAHHSHPYNIIALTRLEFTDLVQWLRYMILSICGSRVPTPYPKIHSEPVIIPPRSLSLQELHWDRTDKIKLFRYELQAGIPGAKWEASIAYKCRNAGSCRGGTGEAPMYVRAAYVVEVNMEPVEISCYSKTFKVLNVEWGQATVRYPPKLGEVMMGLADAAARSMWEVNVLKDE